MPREGVLVNAICPGPTKSELWVNEGGLADQSAALSGLASREEAIEKAGAGRPIGRLAEVDEIASAIVFLCSERRPTSPAPPGAWTAARCKSSFKRGGFAHTQSRSSGVRAFA